MRVFAAGLITETNTFAPWPTGLRGFSEEGPFRGDATTRGKDTETGVLASGLARFCAGSVASEFVEGLLAHAQPSGRTVQSVYEGFRDEIPNDLKTKGPFDVALLFLHGKSDGAAGLSTIGEGDILARARAIVGSKAATGARTRSALPPAPCRQWRTPTAIVLMKEYPHTDYLERGKELFDISTPARRKAG